MSIFKKTFNKSYKELVTAELKEEYIPAEINAMGAGSEDDGPVEITDEMLEEEENERA